MKQVVLIDAKNSCYRFHYKMPNLSSKGRPTSILYGIPSMLLSLQRKIDAPLVMCWDGKPPTWRHKLTAGEEREYKGNRDAQRKVGKLINAQVPILQKFLSDIGIRNFEVPHLEADDLIGILSRTLSKKSYEVIIYSGDKDFYQLLSDTVKIWRPTRGEKKPTLIEASSIKEEYGINPEDWPKMRALCGDSSDNIGMVISKCGPKTSAKLVSQGLDTSLKSFDDLPMEVRLIHAKFHDVWDKVYRNYLLSRIIRKSGNKNLDSKIKSDITLVLNDIARNGIARQKSKVNSVSFRNMVKFMIEYELDELYEQRHNFWGLK